jgi:hypothetical protein
MLRRYLASVAAFLALSTLLGCSKSKYDGEYDGTMDSSYTGASAGSKRVDKKQLTVHVSVTADTVKLEGSGIDKCVVRINRKVTDDKAMTVDIDDDACKLSFDGKSVSMPKGASALFVQGDTLRFDYNPSGTTPLVSQSTLFVKATRAK